MTLRNKTVYLTEGDCFMLALEKKHMRHGGVSNNTCRYLLTVDGAIEHWKHSERKLTPTLN